jgi:hypothetical protein
MSKALNAMQQAQHLLRWTHFGVCRTYSGPVLDPCDIDKLLTKAIAAEEAKGDEAVVWTDNLDRVDVRVRRSDDRAASGGGVKELFNIPLFTRPTNCGSGHCSCVDDECQPASADDRAALITAHRNVASWECNDRSIRDLATATANMLAADALADHVEDVRGMTPMTPEQLAAAINMVGSSGLTTRIMRAVEAHHGIK